MAKTVKQASEKLGVCTKTIRRRINDGSLPAYRVGKALRIKDEDIDTYIQQNAT